MIIPAIPYCPMAEGSVPEPGMDYGYAIRACFARLRADDWLLFFDHDIVFFGADPFRPFEEAVQKKPDAGLFTCPRWIVATGQDWLLPPGEQLDRKKSKGSPEAYDLIFHNRIAKRLRVNYGGKLKDVTAWEELPGGTPGSCIHLVSKRVFDAVGGFKAGFKSEGIDYDFYERVRTAGYRIYLVQSAYAVHLKGK